MIRYKDDKVDRDQWHPYLTVHVGPLYELADTLDDANAALAVKEAEIARLTEYARELMSHIERRGMSCEPGTVPAPANAPGHCHAQPGVWDRSNSPYIAGKPCAWCAKWFEISAALQVQPQILGQESGA